MGKDTPYIMEGDGEADIQSHIIKLLGLNWWEFINDEAILSREYLEQNIEKILKVVKDPSKSPGYFQILGYYILKTGASISDDLRYNIAEASQWKYEETLYPSKEMEEDRKIVLKDFRDKILNHKPGRITRLLEDGGGFGPNILIPKKRIENLLGIGCSLQMIYNNLKKGVFKNITMDNLIENFKWHFHIDTSIESQSSNAIFKHGQKLILREAFKKYFAMGIRTPKEMQKKLISLDNPEGIRLDDLAQLVPEYLEVGSWEEAITSYGYPNQNKMDTYLKEACGINTEKLYENEEVITRERLEGHYKDLEFMIDRWEDPIGYLKLGLLILKTGSKLTYALKNRIINFTNRLIENQNANIEMVTSFQDKIKNHKAGKITDLILTESNSELWSKIKGNITKISSLKYLIDEGIISGINLEELGSIIKEIYYSLCDSLVEQNRILAIKLAQLLFDDLGIHVL